MNILAHFVNHINVTTNLQVVLDYKILNNLIYNPGDHHKWLDKKKIVKLLDNILHQLQ